MTATETLAGYIEDCNYEELPEAVRREAKLRIADVIGTGLSGAETAVSAIGEFALCNGGAGEATIWGSGKKTSPAWAALANGTMTFHLELDDVHRTSHTHPGVSVIPAALAICEQKGLGGKELINAVVLGYDCCIRAGLTVSPSIYVDRTFLAPGTLSVFGAAAAAAKLMGLDREQTMGALGGVSYFGPTACFESFKLGAGIKDMIMGWGNFCGIYGAQLATMGFGGPATALEGDFGFCKTTSATYDLKRLYEGLGTNYEILNTGVKPYACCRQHHAAIDCMLELRETYGIGPKDVKRVLVKTFVVSSRGNQKNPSTVAEAKYSIPYIMAVALKYGKAWREQFSEELVRDEQLLQFAGLVDVEADLELDKLYDEKWPSIVTVYTKDGRRLTARHDLPKGEPEFPCTEETMKEKFVSLACDAVSQSRAEDIWNAVSELETMENINQLTNMLTADR